MTSGRSGMTNEEEREHPKPREVDQLEAERQRVLETLIILETREKELNKKRKELSEELEHISLLESTLHPVREQYVTRLGKIDRAISSRFEAKFVEEKPAAKLSIENFIEGLFLALIGILLLWPRTPIVRLFLGIGFLLAGFVVILIRLVQRGVFKRILS